MYILFFLLQKFRQSVDCFIYCSIYKGTDMILCCWHLLTYQKINSIGRRIKKISYDLEGSSKNNDNSQQPMSSTESLWNHLQDLINVWRQRKWMKDKRCVFLDFGLGWNQTKIYCPWHNDHKIVLHVSVSKYTDWCTGSLFFSNVFK